MIHLEQVTKDNWKRAIFVTSDIKDKYPLIENWVMSAAFSIVQSVYETEWDYRIIMDDNHVIGGVLYGIWDYNGTKRYLLCRFVIDVNYQGKGLGQKALPIILRYMYEQYKCNDIYLTVEKSNSRAIHIYEKYGFIATGEVDEGEEVYVLRR
ncbi:spermine/spermidine acetyltransferase [Lachnospiraceae bacterium KM106-2]|nr:spermine/spermidine acetyltransferase [Lachnospiraceae bacterium KM106-2]